MSVIPIGPEPEEQKAWPTPTRQRTTIFEAPRWRRDRDKGGWTHGDGTHVSDQEMHDFEVWVRMPGEIDPLRGIKGSERLDMVVEAREQKVGPFKEETP